jgi:hypothetical protein
LCRYLEAQGVATARGNLGWTAGSLYRILKSRAYLGELRYLDAVNDHAHAALIDPVTWERAQAPRVLVPRSPAQPVLLSGLVRCAGCSMMMSCSRRNDRPEARAFFVCRVHFARGTCSAPATVQASALNEYVIAAVFKLLGRRRRPPLAELAAAERNLATAAARLASYRDNDRLRALLNEDQFAGGVATRVERVRRARVALAEVRARADTQELPSLPELRRAWSSLDLAEQRALIAQVIDCVFVASGRGNLNQRITVCPIRTAPSPLSRQGDAGGTPVRAIKPRRGWLNPQRPETDGATEPIPSAGCGST